MPAAVLLLAGSTAGEAARAPRQADPSRPTVPGEVIVGLRAGVSQMESDGLLAAVGAHPARGLRRAAARVARIDPSRLEAVLKRLRSDPRVAYAEPNYRLTALDTPNDPAFAQLWGLVNTGQTVDGSDGTPDADIDAEAAWDVTTGSPSVVVGVIDTGVDFSHPDLGGSVTAANPLMWTNPGETGSGRESNGVDDDGNGYVDDWRGWDWVDDDNDPQDQMGHGTHVAGTIGALGDNGIGIAGVNWNARVMALRFLDAQGGGDLADAVEAVRYATAMGARITNNSWGGGGFSQAMLDALREADARGRLFVAAAGNSATDNDELPQYPASYDVPNVVSVAATDQDDDLASFSSYGRTSVHLGAPGTHVYSTVLGGGYDWYDGTSMATPHVAGTAALAAAASLNATAAGLKALLLRTVDPKPSLAGRTAADGRLNAARALTCAGSPTAWLESPRPGFHASVNEPVPVAVIGTSCAAPAGASVTATVNGVPVTLTPRGDGLYTGTYVPAATGPVTITATASVGGVSDSRSASGTVDDDYRLVEEPFAWLDATVGGTRLSLGDDAAAAVALPFPFRFYGEPVASVNVSSNGYVVFGSGAAASYQNVAIPNETPPNGLVAAYWDDLNPSAAGAVWHRVVGVAPNRRLAISWVGVRHYSVPGPVSFQVVLEEGTDEIVLAYQDTDHGSSSYNHGASATVGVESADGDRGTAFLYNQARLASYQGTTALRFSRSAPVVDVEPPAPPSGLTASPGELSVVLDWAASAEADLAGYHVYRQGADGAWVRVATTAAPSYTDGGLTAGMLHSYQVTAFDRAVPPNESAPSAVASATPTGDVTPPAVPTGLSASAGDGRVTLDWADNADAVAEYRVYRDGLHVATSEVSGHVDGGLTNGTTYAYRVSALDAEGNESALSSEVTATPFGTPPPPPDPNYRVLEEPFAWVDATVGGTRLSLTDDTEASVALAFPFRFYGESVASVKVSSNGYLAFAGVATSYRNVAIPNAAAPNGLVAAYWDDLNPALAGAVWYRTVGVAPNRRLVVSWIGVRHVAVAGPVTFQTVLEEGTDAIVFAYQDTDHGSSTYNHGASATVGVESADGSLGTGFLYNQARLAAYQSTTALRLTRSAPVVDVEPPAAPSGLTASPGELSVVLDWAASAEADLAGYHVYRQGADGGWVRIATTAAPVYTDGGLTDGTLYSYRVTAFDRAVPPNESAPSAVASATPTGDVTPPAVPTGLSASAGDGRVTLDWADNADAVAEYQIYRDGAPAATVSASAHIDTGLANGTSYSYRVSARDGAGNESGLSAPVAATPQAPPPPTGDYRLVEEPFAWLDATVGGTRLSLGDDAAAAVALPFPFRFYGEPVASVNVSSNGYVVFGSGAATSYRNAAIPDGAAPNGLVAAYWDDLNPPAAGAVWHRAVGVAPNRRLVISWVGVRHYTVAGTISFQVVLDEGTDEIVLAYQDTDHGSPTYDHGASATVGLESPDGATGIQFLRNQARLAGYAGVTSLRFTNR